MPEGQPEDVVTPGAGFRVAQYLNHEGPSPSTPGKSTCENCGTQTVPGQQSPKGVSPAGNETNRDHIIPRARNGSGTVENGQILCRSCNIKKSDKMP